jgi:hypothetical protein
MKTGANEMFRQKNPRNTQRIMNFLTLPIENQKSKISLSARSDAKSTLAKSSGCVTLVKKKDYLYSRLQTERIICHGIVHGGNKN